MRCALDLCCLSPVTRLLKGQNNGDIVPEDKVERPWERFYRDGESELGLYHRLKLFRNLRDQGTVTDFFSNCSGYRKALLPYCNVGVGWGPDTGGKVLLFTRKARAKFLWPRPLFKVQRSLVTIERTTVSLEHRNGGKTCTTVDSWNKSRQFLTIFWSIYP